MNRWEHVVAMGGSTMTTGTLDAEQGKPWVAKKYQRVDPAKIHPNGLSGMVSTTLEQLANGFLTRLWTVPFRTRQFHGRWHATGSQSINVCWFKNLLCWFICFEIYSREWKGMENYCFCFLRVNFLHKLFD